MSKAIIIACAVLFTACLDGEDELDYASEESELLGFRVAPTLQRELIRIDNTPTGHMVVNQARNRGLWWIRVRPLAGNIEGLYTSNGVISIEDPNNAYTFQRLAHELLHAAGYHPHFFPDKGLVGKMCAQANAVCPSWN